MISPHCQPIMVIQDALGAAIESLPERSQQVLALYYYEDLTLRRDGPGVDGGACLPNPQRGCEWYESVYAPAGQGVAANLLTFDRQEGQNLDESSSMTP